MTILIKNHLNIHMLSNIIYRGKSSIEWDTKDYIVNFLYNISMVHNVCDIGKTTCMVVVLFGISLS